MALTRIDCDFFHQAVVSSGSSSFVALNPHAHPGSLVAAGSYITTANIGSQIACRLSLEHFVEGILSYFDDGAKATGSNQVGDELSVELLKRAFKQANTSVYEFGHKLAAGGRLAASLIGLVIEERVVAAGRVGDWGAYLYRAGELYPFFEDSADHAVYPLIGTQSLTTVETASVLLEPMDKIFFFSKLLERPELRLLTHLANEVEFTETHACERLMKAIFPYGSEVLLGMCAEIGPQAIYLSESFQARSAQRA